MKICAFGRALPDHGIGGMERHFQVVIRGLAARGHKVTVPTTACPGRTEKRNEENISMHFLSGTIPGSGDPHPFERVKDDRYWLMGHNGTIDKDVLVSLIRPDYLAANPPQYGSNQSEWIDSDLYQIFLF